MAWLTSYELINKLEDLKRNGILINLVVDDNKYNKIEKLKIISNKLKVVTVVIENEKNVCIISIV